MKKYFILLLLFILTAPIALASGCENLKLDDCFYEKNCTLYKIGDEDVKYSYGQISQIGDREVRYLR